MKIYELKADPKLPHHYIIAVAIHPMNSSDPGKMYLKYRPFYVHHSQIKKFRNVALLIQDKLFPTSQLEALKIYDLQELVYSFSMFELSASVNLCTLHHFSSEFKIEEDWFSTFIKSTNNSKISKEQLLNARI